MSIIKLGKMNEVKTEMQATTVAESAAEASAQTSVKQSGWEDPAILREREDVRTERSRHYVMNDGSAKSVVTAVPTGFYDESTGTWKEIDNTLTEKNGVYETKSGGKYTTRLSKAQDGAKVKVSGEGVSVAWEYLGAKTETAGSVSLLSVQDRATMREKVEAFQGMPAEGRVMYENITANSDLEYRIQGGRLKENIIVKERAEEYRYLFSLAAEGLSLRLAQDAKSLELYCEKDGQEEVKFTIPAPYMYDAGGETSEDVFYEIDSSEDGKFSFAVVADAGWLNAENRTFPVTIDPQLVYNDLDSFFSYQSFRRNVVTSSSGVNANWTEYSDEQGAVAGKDLSFEYKSNLIINKEKILLLYKNVIFARLNLKVTEMYKYGSINFNGEDILVDNPNGYVSMDISDRFLSSGTTCTIVIGPNTGFDVGGCYAFGAPVLELEYLTNESVKPTKKSFTLAGNAEGTLDLKTGEFTVGLSDLSDDGSMLGLGVSHLFKKNNTDFHMGKNFRLNLNETFSKKGRTETLDASYIYTDASGMKHGFKDFYYYLDQENRKIYVEKENVEIDLDGNLKYTDLLGSVYEVHKQERTSSGLQAVTEIDGFINSEFIDQKQEEYKQLKEKIRSYENTLKEYVIIDENNYTTIAEFSALTNEGFHNFLDKLNSSRLLLTQSNADTYRSLQNQIQSLYTQLDSLAAQKEAMTYSIKSMQCQQEQLWCTNQRALIGEKDNDSDDEDDTPNTDEGDLINFEGKLLNDEKYKILLSENEFNNNEANRINTYNQWNNLNEKQLCLFDDQIEQANVSKQIFLDQVSKLKENQLKARLLFEDYYKEYVNLSNQLAQMDRQMPVNYLTDGEVVKGYNADGRLVAVMDNYENTVAINYDNRDRIESVVDDNDRAIVFTYNPQGRLASLTDQRGRKTRYYYDGEGRLTTVRSGARWLKFKYNTATNDLERVWSSDMLQTDLVYTDSKLTKITQSSVGAVNGETSVKENDSGITGAVSCTVTQIEYPSETKTVVTQDTNTKEYYLFNDLGNKSQYCLEEYGKVTKAEKYDYVAYVSDKTSFAAKGKLNLYAYTDHFDFGTEDYEEATLDEFNNPVTSTKFCVRGNYSSEKVVTTYEYDDEHRCVKADASVVISTGNSGTKTYSQITEYAYNSAGKKVRTESYIEGEEAANGRSIEEAVYDAKGHLVKSFKYNSLDTSSKFYTESVYAEDGTVTAEKDETGEVSVEYEYIEGTTVVRSERYANGSVLAYGHDGADNVTALTQSTAEGEENSTQRVYTCGEVTELVSGNNVVKYEYDARRRVTKIGLNGTDAYETYTYTEGETEDVTEVKNAKDETFVTVKDKFGNVLRTLYAGAGAEAGTYESHGCVRFTYDVYHNVTKEEDRYTGGTRQYEYTNAAFGTVRKMSVTAERDAEALTEEYGYDGYDKLIQKSLTGAVTQTYAYHYRTDAKQSLEYAELPDNVRAYPQTDKLGRNTGKELMDLAGQRKFGEYVYYRKVGDHATNMPSAVYFGGVQNGKYVIRDNVKYQYDARGNICKIFENGALVVRYEYDSIDRLVREDNKKLGFTVLFAYDNNGNILSKRRTLFTLKTDVEECEFTETLYSYDGDELLSYGDEACVYADAVGNPTTYRGKTAGWERGRLLNYLDGNSFSYDGQGRRIKKNNTVFTYDGEGNLVKQSDGLEFVYDTNGLSYVKYNNAVYFYRKDAQGNIIALLDNSGNTVVKYRYDAWGNHAVQDANGADIADANHIGVLNPFRYRGYYYDTETELYYLQTRYYDPETGRFITIDGIEYLDPETINGLNLYAYCGNNPVMRTDENGNSFWDSLLKVLGAIAIVVATVAVSVMTAGTAIGVIAAGAAIGASVGLVGGGITGAINAAASGGNIFDGFASGALSGTITGAISGAVAASPIGLSGQVLINMAISGSEYLISTKANNQNVEIAGFLWSVVSGGVAGFVGGRGAMNGLNSLMKFTLIKSVFQNGFKGVNNILNSIIKSTFATVLGGQLKGFIA